MLLLLPPRLVARPGGTAALALESSQAPRPDDAAPDKPAEWRWAGSIALDDAVLDLGLGLRQVTGRITGQMGWAGSPEAMDLKADVVLDRLMFGPHRLGRVTAALSKPRNSPILQISRISGQAFNGRLDGFAQVRLSDPVQYGLSLKVHNVDLPGFLNAWRSHPARRFELQGLLSGGLRMTAISGDPSSRKATGELKISRARLYKLPVVLGLLHLVYLTLPSNSAFDRAEVYYYLQGHRLVFRRIRVQGSALSMLGAGTVDLKTKQIRLTFLAGPPHELPRLAGLTDVLEGIASGLTAWRVTGTLDYPRRRPVPLRNPKDTLRELFEPDRR